MEHLRTIGLLDSDGQPFDPRIERVLIQLLPRLRREFPSLQDEVGLAEIMEEAGRRIRHREMRGPIERLHGYAWVTVRSIATSRMRLGATRLIQRTIAPEAAVARLAITAATDGTAEQVERRLLLRELLATLSSEERLVCLWKQAGFSSQEIAAHRGRSVEAVDTMFSRAKEKLRTTLGIDGNAKAGRVRTQLTGKKMSDEQHSGDDRRFRDDLDELLLRANPNPRRIGCLRREILSALAAREQPLGDPGYEHLLQCSECYREFRTLQGTRDQREA